MTAWSRQQWVRSALIGGALALCLQSNVQAQDVFTLTTPGAKDNAFFQQDNASSANDCGGNDVSPALAWTNPPAGTQSFALILHDPDGQKGLGVDHWVHYGLPGDTRQIAVNVGSNSKLPGIGGKNTRGGDNYAGPCPPPGDSPHHYVIQLYALDLPADAFTPGLTATDLQAKMKDHILGVSSVVRRYQR